MRVAQGEPAKRPIVFALLEATDRHGPWPATSRNGGQA
jgi:hypothetical protein